MHRFPNLFGQTSYWHSPAGQLREASFRKHQARMVLCMIGGLAASSPPQRGRW